MLYHFSEDVRRLNPGLEEELTTVPASKYHNARTEGKGLRFQSGHEAAEISKLILLDERHQIFSLRLQVAFPLPGKMIYRADAVYLDEKLKVHVVDAKAWDIKTKKFLETPEFKIKRELFKERYGIQIEEI